MNLIKNPAQPSCFDLAMLKFWVKILQFAVHLIIKQTNLYMCQLMNSQNSSLQSLLKLVEGWSIGELGHSS